MPTFCCFNTVKEPRDKRIDNLIECLYICFFLLTVIAIIPPMMVSSTVPDFPLSLVSPNLRTPILRNRYLYNHDTTIDLEFSESTFQTKGSRFYDLCIFISIIKLRLNTLLSNLRTIFFSSGSISLSYICQFQIPIPSFLKRYSYHVDLVRYRSIRCELF